MNDEVLFVEKYRPKTVTDTILPENLRKTFQKFVDDKSIPNIILSGSAGVGKTTIAKAMVNEIGSEYMIINGSLNAGIDTLRTKISDFASSFAFDGNRKYVIIDEADYLSASNVMPALRNFMEEFSANCGFILTCNYINRIIPPLQSRCSIIDFSDNSISGQKSTVLITQFFKRLIYILDSEKIEYDKKAVAELLKMHYPDVRRVINELQRYSTSGIIDSGILSNFTDDNFSNLVKYVSKGNYTAARKWAAENKNIETLRVFRKFYDLSLEVITKESRAHLARTINKYQINSSMAIDQEINLSTFFLSVMTNDDIEFI